MKNHRPPLLLKGLEKVILALPRRRLRKKMNRKLAALESVLVTCTEERKRFSRLNLPEMIQLLNASQFCFIAEGDFTVLVGELMQSDHEWTKRVFGRFLALTLIECAEDVPQVLGKDFREALAKLVTDVAHLKRVSQLTS